MQATLTLFGHFQFVVSGDSVKFATEHCRALLAYLAMEPGAHERAKLATLLWPERPEAIARQNLRQTLASLKHSLRPFSELDSLLVSTPKSIELSATAVATDAQIFSQLWAVCAVHTHPQLVVCEECIARFQQAAQLYTGEFLHTLFVKNSIPFEEWLRFLRERFHHQVLEVLDTLTLHAERMADYSQMLRNASRQLALAPWNEESSRQLMRALALRGQSTAALAHYAAFQRTLAEEFGVLPSLATTALYEQIKRGDFDGAMRRIESGRVEGQKIAAVDEESKTLESDERSWTEATKSSHRLHTHLPTPHNLPSSLTPFIGREHEVDEIRQRLADPETRLLTLVGLGGIGKTRLAIEAAQKLYTWQTTKAEVTELHLTKSSIVPDFSDGLFFVSLASLSSSTALLPTIATTLGIELGREPDQAVINYLRNKAILLILDNFEHLLDGVPFVVEVLKQTSRLKIVATSRERLNVRAEQLYPVQPLTHALQGELTEATTWSAVRLFAERACRVLPNFKVTKSNLSALLRICDIVQGLPLGIEMAAAQCDVLTLDEIASEIERSIDFLTLDYHDLPARHHSMRAVFDWSWRLLDEDEALVLRQLAVFRGGFTRRASEIICGATLRVLNRLVNKSMLRRSPEPSENSATTIGRYEFHPLVWQFVQEKLNALPDEQAKNAARHSNFYLAFVAERERRLMLHEPRQAMMEIQAELDNVRQAWRWAVYDHATEMLGSSAYGLWQFYQLTSLTAEGVEAFGQAVTAFMNSSAQGQGESTVWQQQHVLSKLSALWAHLLSSHGNHDEAIVNAQRAITLATVACSEAKSRQVTVLGQLVLGQALYKKSQFSESQCLLEQVLQAIQDEMALDKTAQDEAAPDEIWPEMGVLARLYLAAIERTHGNFALAYRHLVDALHLCQQGGKLRAEVRVQMNLGATARAMRDLQGARQAYEQALPLTIELHDQWGEGVVRHELGEVVRELGEYSLALTLCQQALSVFVDINERLGQAYSLAELIELSTCLGQFARASTYQVQLAGIVQQLKAPDVERESLVARTILALYEGNDEYARICARQLWQLVQPMGSPIYQAETLLLLGHAQASLPLPAAAAESYTQALALYQSLNAPTHAAEALAGLADLALAQGDLAQALHFTEPVLATLEQHPNVGVHEPFSIYLTCYRVLAATHDHRARTFLKSAHALLQRYALHIDDEGLRNSFLQNVSGHRQLVAAYEKMTKKRHFRRWSITGYGFGNRQRRYL